MDHLSPPIPRSRPLLGTLAGLALLCACASTSPVLKKGLELEQTGQYQEAVSFYASALAAGELPADKGQERLAAAKDALAGQRAREGKEALENGDLDTALRLTGQARELAPQASPVLDLQARVSSALRDKATGYTQTQEPLKALKVLDSLLETLPQDEAARAMHDRLVTAATDELETAIRDYDARGLPGNAYLSSLVLEQVRSEDPKARADVAARREALLARFRVPVTWEVDGRGPLFDATSSSLAGGLSFRAPFLETRGGAPTSETLHLKLSKLDDAFNTDVVPGVGVRSVPAGTRKAPNPERERLSTEVKSLEPLLRTLEDRMDRLNTTLAAVTNPTDKARLQNEVDRLGREYHQLSTQYASGQETLDQLPPLIDVVDTREVRFPLEYHRRQASVRFHYLATCPRQDLPLKVDLDLEAKADERIEVYPAYPEYGIAASPLRFSRPDDQLRREAVLNLAKVVGATTDMLLNDIMILERRAGRDLLAAGKLDEATERLVRVLFGSVGEPAPEVVELLQKRGVDSLARARGQLSTNP